MARRVATGPTTPQRVTESPAGGTEGQPVPGQPCPACKRPVPDHSKPPGPIKKRFTVAIPRGEEGIIEEMLDQLVDRYRAAYGSEFPDKSHAQWRYLTLHYALHVAIESPSPSDTGE